MRHLITTTKGLMDPEDLEKREGVYEDDNERTAWVEYYDDGELVHRSAHVHAKRWPELGGILSAAF